MERTVRFAGRPVPVGGKGLAVGDRAPDFRLVANDLKDVTLQDTRGKVRVFLSLPSLDTSVCDTETRRFNQEATRMPGVDIYAVSMDLPFAQKRWCAGAGIERVRTLSDYRLASFGDRWGVLMPEVRLLARAVFVVDQDDIVRHVEYVPDAGQEPSYDAALSAVRKLL